MSTSFGKSADEFAAEFNSFAKPAAKLPSSVLLKVGDKVRYQPEHYGEHEWENGIIKEVRDGVIDSVWVVYHCAGEWDRYIDYTSAKTNLRDLRFGWR